LAITYTARWIFPVAGPPLRQGTITLEAERIVAVLPAGERSADIDLGNAALTPGFVNAHTHLDLTGLHGQCPPQADFTAWLRSVIAHRRTRPREQIEADIAAGIRQCLASGTTLIGDISSQGWSWPQLAASSLRAVVFLELLGLTPQRAVAAVAAARSWLDGLPPTLRVRPGLSPHAPYSVHHSLFTRIAELAGRRNLPIAVHLAETRAELQLLERHSGPFQPFLEELGVWDPAGLAKDAGDVVARCRSAGLSSFVHANYLSADVNLPVDATIIYCPRTHAAFGHGPHPVREFLRRRHRVALGTDSLASNPDLNVLNEARFLHTIHSDIPGDQLLRMITRNGAEALGCVAETGSLEVGKSADLAIVPLPNREEHDPHMLLFANDVPAIACCKSV